MSVFYFISTICTLTLLVGAIIKLIITIPYAIIMATYENIKVLLFVKIISTIVVSSTIVFYVISYTSGNPFIFSFLHYILGYYSFMVMFTLVTETEKETLQDEQKSYPDRIMLSATSYDKYMIIVSLGVFILAILFPVLSHYYIPFLFCKFYTWLISYKVISWITYFIGGLAILYILKYTIVLIIFLIGSLIHRR